MELAHLVSTTNRELGVRTKVGYLLPTREKVMAGDHSARDLLDLGKLAADLGFDSLWVGDSLLARPRHDPLTILAGVAAAVPDVQLGTAVLLPALRNPVVLAQQLATIDQLSKGRLVIGAGIGADAPAIRAEFLAASVPFEKRVGRLLEGFRLCRALWSGEPVDWDGRWKLDKGLLAPLPYTKGGPPIWLAATVDPGIERAAKYFDGWFPLGPDASEFGRRQKLFATSAEKVGRDSSALTTALYLTIAIADTEAGGDVAINEYLQNYYGMPAPAMRAIQACYGGPLDQVLAFIRSYVEQGAQHIVVRVVGEHATTLQQLSARRDEIG